MPAVSWRRNRGPHSRRQRRKDEGVIENGNGGLIVLIEDDTDVANAWSMLLEAEGFSVDVPVHDFLHRRRRMGTWIGLFVLAGVFLVLRFSLTTGHLHRQRSLT